MTCPSTVISSSSGDPTPKDSAATNEHPPRAIELVRPNSSSPSVPSLLASTACCEAMRGKRLRAGNSSLLMFESDPKEDYDAAASIGQEMRKGDAQSTEAAE